MAFSIHACLTINQPNNNKVAVFTSTHNIYIRFHALRLLDFPEFLQSIWINSISVQGTHIYLSGKSLRELLAQRKGLSSKSYHHHSCLTPLFPISYRFSLESHHSCTSMPLIPAHGNCILSVVVIAAVAATATGTATRRKTFRSIDPSSLLIIPIFAISLSHRPLLSLWLFVPSCPRLMDLV